MIKWCLLGKDNQSDCFKANQCVEKCSIFGLSLAGFAAFGTPHLHSAWQQLLFRFRSFENSFDPSSSRSEFLPNFGITRNSSDFSNRVLSETGRRLHFPTSPTSLVGTPSSKAMPSANEVESDVFLRDKTPTSSSDRLKSSCDNSELEDRKDHGKIASSTK